MSKARRHTHKYHHVDTPYGKLWSCALPDCNHHMPAHYEATLPGKYSICWQCGEKFILNPENMKQDKPICENCKLGIGDNLDKIVDLIRNI